MRFAQRGLFLIFIVWTVSAQAESGYDAWLRYQPLPALRTSYSGKITVVVACHKKFNLSSGVLPA